MKSMHLLLDEAERLWRDEVQEHFPLHGDMPVVRETKPDGRDWTFYTDLKKIFARIAGDENLQKRFGEVVGKFWTGAPEELARDTLHYLLFHELYHPLEAPFSVEGDDNDNKRIHQAIRRGLVAAQPDLTPLEQLVKVQASQNGVKDFILDNRFYLDNAQREHVRDDIIPVWDVLELEPNKPATDFYTITRLHYGLLYGPQSTHDFFRKKAGRRGTTIAEKALSALLEQDVHLPRGKGFLKKVQTWFGRDADESEVLETYAQRIRSVFSGDDRYKGIERFMKVLGPYVKDKMSQGRSDMHGENSGTSPQNILQDLLDDMTPEEQQEFVQGLQDGEGSLSKPKNETTSGARPYSADTKDIDLIAPHEYYKRNHPNITIIGGKKIGESVIMGNREYWALKRSTVLTEDQLSRLNLGRIDTLQRRTKLPWLIEMGNGMFRLNEYEVNQRQVKDIRYVDAQIDVPDVTEFYLDSSGSMFKENDSNLVYTVNDGSSWDMLSHVLYGLADALRQGGQKVGKQPKMRIHNVADTQVSSALVPVDTFWRGDMDMLRVLFKPDNGYGTENLDIQQYADGQKRTSIVVTDGALVIRGRTEREAQKMKKLAAMPQTHVALFEIGGTYSLGKAIQGDPNVAYHQVHDKEQMFNAGIEVLLSK